MQHRLRGLRHAQHRQHAAHRRQLVRYRDQHLALARVAEVAVDFFFHLGQGGAQFVHHAAHRLAIADAAVQLLHPDLKRARLSTSAHGVDAVGQVLHAAGQQRVIELAVLQAGVEVQHAGGDFHRQRRRRLTGRCRSLRSGGLQGLRQVVARREQLRQRITDQRELFVQPGQAMQLATGHTRPAVARRRQPLARQRDHGRVETAQARCFVVGRRRASGQRPGLGDGCQARRGLHRMRPARVRAKEQQVLRKAVRQIELPTRTHAQLRQQPRGQALGIHISVEQAERLRLEDRRSQLPESRRPTGWRTGAEVGAEITRLGQRGRPGLAHQGQHQCFHLAARGVVGAARGAAAVGRQFAPLKIGRPQIGRVHAIGAGELLHRAVLREQHHR